MLLLATGSDWITCPFNEGARLGSLPKCVPRTFVSATRELARMVSVYCTEPSCRLDNKPVTALLHPQ